MAVGRTFSIVLDKAKIRQIGDEWSIRFLFRAGSFIRRAAQQSQRRRRGISRPGNPPHAHTRRYKKSIRFEVDKDTKTVAVGPMAADVGEILEHGGMQYHDDREEYVPYAARPHMRPALEKGVRDVQQKSRDPIPRIWT